MNRYGIKARAALTVLIYKKILKLSKNSFEKTSVGQILNIMANDLNRIDEINYQAPYYIAAPLQTIVVIYVMWSYLGIACLGGLSILFLFLPFQGFMGRWFNKFR